MDKLVSDCSQISLKNDLIAYKKHQTKAHNKFHHLYILQHKGLKLLKNYKKLPITNEEDI